MFTNSYDASFLLNQGCQPINGQMGTPKLYRPQTPKTDLQNHDLVGTYTLKLLKIDPQKPPKPDFSSFFQSGF